jgi:hypothetical protein
MYTRTHARSQRLRRHNSLHPVLQGLAVQGRVLGGGQAVQDQIRRKQVQERRDQGMVLLQVLLVHSRSCLGVLIVLFLFVLHLVC